MGVIWGVYVAVGRVERGPNIRVLGRVVRPNPSVQPDGDVVYRRETLNDGYFTVVRVSVQRTGCFPYCATRGANLVYLHPHGYVDVAVVGIVGGPVCCDREYVRVSCYAHAGNGTQSRTVAARTRNIHVSIPRVIGCRLQVKYRRTRRAGLLEGHSHRTYQTCP